MIRRSSLPAVCILATLLANGASAFEPLSPLRHWFNTPRDVIVDNTGLASVNDGDGGVAAAVAAVTPWNSAGAGNITSSTQVTGGQIPADPNDIIAPNSPSYLVLSDPFNVCKGTCLAATLTGFYDESSKRLCDGDVFVEIVDSDIVFNLGNDFTTAGESDGCTAFPPKRAEYSLEAVVAHEVGHLIGLGHSDVSGSLMFPSVAPCTDPTSLLQTDDENGAKALYACSVSSCAGDETNACFDGIDNDCDGVADGGDPDCGGGPSCGDGVCDASEDSCSCAVDCGTAPVSEALMCTDGADNDCDFAVDCSDSDCSSDPACDTGSCGGNKASCTQSSDCCSGNCRGGVCRGN